VKNSPQKLNDIAGRCVIEAEGTDSSPLLTEEGVRLKAKLPIIVLALLLTVTSATWAQGNLSANPYVPNSTSNPYGAGSPYNPNSINNPFGPYGSPYSPKSANNPYATDAPRLYDDQGHYHGKLSANPYDPDSTSNQYGRYGSPYSPDSINNPYGAGSPYRNDSPNNRYGSGMHMKGDGN
jgi:hypothetical protein